MNAPPDIAQVLFFADAGTAQNQRRVALWLDQSGVITDKVTKWEALLRKAEYLCAYSADLSANLSFKTDNAMAIDLIAAILIPDAPLEPGGTEPAEALQKCRLARGKLSACARTFLAMPPPRQAALSALFSAKPETAVFLRWLGVSPLFSPDSPSFRKALIHHWLGRLCLGKAVGAEPLRHPIAWAYLLTTSLTIVAENIPDIIQQTDPFAKQILSERLRAPCGKKGCGYCDKIAKS